jgi:hypothetical protein
MNKVMSEARTLTTGTIASLRETAALATGASI